MKRYAILLGFSIISALAILCCVELGWLSYKFFITLQKTIWWLPLVWTPALTILIVYIIQKYAPGAAGTGTPQALIPMDPRCPSDQVHHFISVRLAIAKVLLTPVAFLAGLSLGNEGPAVQIGASIMNSSKKYLGDISTRTLAMIGNGIGIAVCFSSIIGGLLFTIEKSGQSHSNPTRFYNYLCISIAGLLSLTVLEYPHFGQINFGEWDTSLLVYAIITVFISIIVSDLWTRSLLLVNTKILSQFKNQHPYIFVGTLGLLVAVIGILTGTLTTGLSDEYTKNLFVAENEYNLWSVPAKFLACLFTAWSGVSAGMFIPLLILGGGIGGFVVSVFAVGSSSILVSLGMAAFLSAVSRAPIASCFIVADVIGRYDLLLPLLFTTIVSDKISNKITPDLWSTQVDLICKRFK